MTKDQYQKYYKNNAKIIKHCLETKTTDLSEIIFCDGSVGKDHSFDFLCARWADILACSAIGAVPNMSRRGSDGILYYQNSNVPKEVETKLCGVTQADLALGSRKGLYYSTNLENYYSKCAISSHFHGSFDVNMSETTMASKERDTFLVLFDRTENRVIDAYGIYATQVLNLIENKKQGKSITFKLSAFQSNGFRMGTQWETETFPKWEQRMIKKTLESKRFIKY